MNPLWHACTGGWALYFVGHSANRRGIQEGDPSTDGNHAGLVFFVLHAYVYAYCRMRTRGKSHIETSCMSSQHNVSPCLNLDETRLASSLLPLQDSWLLVRRYWYVRGGSHHPPSREPSSEATVPTTVL
jgi:hypothetical protein